MNMQKYGDVFLCRVNGADVTVPFADIVFFESCGHYIIMHMKDKKTLTLRGILRDIDQSLSKRGFVRVHRGFLVNKTYILGIKNSVLFLNSVWGSVPIGRSHKEKVVEISGGIGKT